MPSPSLPPMENRANLERSYIISISMKNQSGFTIVELIVTMVVGAILMSSGIMLMTSTQRLSQKQRDLVIANAFAEQKVEALRSSGYLGISNGTTDITSQMPAELKTPRSGSQQITTPSNGLKLVAITLTYNDQGTNRNYSYSTYIGELGVGQY